MILEFTQAFGTWKAGDITDEVKEGTGRALIADGVAKESTESAQLRALVKAEAERTRAETLELTRTMLQGQKPALAGPPTGGGGVNFDTISRTEGPEDRDNNTGKKVVGTFGEFCKCVALYQSVDAPSNVRTWAHTKLRDRYGAEKCDYIIDDKTGDISQTISRTLDYGVETVTRTGTESLGGGPTYGFALKPEYVGSLFEIPMEQSVFSEDTFGVPMGQALELRWPAMDQYRPPVTANGIQQSASFAGFSIGYVGETTTRPSSDGKLSDITFKIVDLTGFTDLSRDLISDNYIAMDAMAVRVFGRAFTWMEDYMGINGTGLGQPEGYLNSLALITVTRKTTNDVLYADLVNMMQSLHAMCWMGARWITNVTNINWLLNIQSASGTFVYVPNALVSQAQKPSIIGNSSYDAGAKVTRPMGTMLGWPVYFTEKVPTQTYANTISLVCPDQYGFARRVGLEVGLSEHFFFSTDRIAYRFKKRHDGKSLWRAPYTQADGSLTQTSPFVTLSA